MAHNKSEREREAVRELQLELDSGERNVRGRRGHIGYARAMLEEINLEAAAAAATAAAIEGRVKGAAGVDMCSGLISFGKGKLIKYIAAIIERLCVCVCLTFL